MKRLFGTFSKFIALVAVLATVMTQGVFIYADEVKIEGTVKVSDFLNVRAAADDDSEILEELHNGDKVLVVGVEGDWYKVSGDHNGYVHADYVAIANDAQAKAKENAAADTNAAAPAQEQAAQEQAAQEQATTQEQAPAQEQAAQEQTAAADSTNTQVDPEEQRLLAALIACECGAGGYDGKLAVGAVVVNRSKFYGGIKEAIYAPYQFGPASSGKLKAVLASNAIDAISLQAAADAISGQTNIGGARYFRNVKSGHAGIVQGNHVFW